MLLDHTIKRVARKEINLFFSSPIAYLFMTTFAAITLFIFFWGESFFARNVADVRPLFEWMPVLLIFLTSTLTMRMWSDERRAGTLEHVLTLPVPLWHFVVGKFLACLSLLLITLAITLPIPLTVALIGNLDWGPVIAGYLATILLGAAYISIGLFASARSDNQIVSLIYSVAFCGLFYLIGSSTLTNFFGHEIGEWLRLLGSGSRFDAITRGLIDLRDFYYYLSIIVTFLVLNTYSLEKERWTLTEKRKSHHTWRAISALLVINVFLVNFWLGHFNYLRIDTTRGNQYSISDATENYLSRLQEPLLIRGYFSSKTHPLLSPLVPKIKDLLKEYEVAGDGRVKVELIDPQSDPEQESEANQKYNIRPVPFQISDRHQASIVNSYFNVLIQYGDEHKILGFRELIEIKSGSNVEVEVALRNPEHDITRAIKSVLNSYQSGGNLFDTVTGEVALKAYISPDQKLPEQLVEFKKVVMTELEKVQAQSSNRFKIDIIDPDDNNGVVAQQIQNDYGFQPFRLGLLSDKSFYFYLTLQQQDQIIQLPLDDLSAASFERNLKSGIKRFASGFTKTVGLVTPKQENNYSPYAPPSGPKFGALEQFLGEELTVKNVDLSSGEIPGDIDILLLMAPKSVDEKQLFAVDQFLMKGGTVIAATAPYSANMGMQGLELQTYDSGLKDWLTHHGLSLEEKLVLDTQSMAFPVPVARNLGGYTVREVHMLDYPFFIDIRDEGLNKDNAITAALPQATVTWASPILIDKDKLESKSTTQLVSSSSESWLSASTDVAPQLDQANNSFKPQGEQSSHLLGAIVQGRFSSYFSGKDSPLLKQPDESKAEASEDTPTPDSAEKNQAEEKASLTVSSVIEKSAESARIILFSSNDFVSDQVLQLSGSSGGNEYLGTLQLVANTVDWSLEDDGLMSIRSRGHYNQTLPPMEQDERTFWEYSNYIVTALLILSIAMIQSRRRQLKQLKHVELLVNA
ncbi:Gldg family protein [Aliikangiella coralliicola]|uniref:ABC transporter permease subunit n=1 Tax=Aliikangiella coralliicola TaxID=2592383 RepID=A0A545UA50_9GAMM|nr:Gldg family protein [Aliikangiella coralliicola]TQV86346.1 ABC transporter permease subunit [Aliikangiella coralliicola]